MKIAVAVVATLLVGIEVSAQKAPPTTAAAQKWLHGLEVRKEKLGRLTAKLKRAAEGEGRNGPVPRSIFCPMALESALVAALTDAHFTTGKNEDFHLLFNAPGEKQYLDVSYTYNERGALLMAGIHRLPAGWTVGIQPGEISAGKFIVLTDDSTGCVYEFDASDPFGSRATVSEDN